MTVTMIERHFQDLTEQEIAEAERQAFFGGFQWKPSADWSEILRSPRVLLMAEAGMGKTYECQSRARAMWDQGKPAFFIELAELAKGELEGLLRSSERQRLDEWKRGEHDHATFFLDSVDELHFSGGNFKTALTRMERAIDGHLPRARFVITTRPVPMDRILVELILPVPSRQEEVSDSEFIDIAMGDRFASNHAPAKNDVPAWRNVTLMPLSNEQIEAFARMKGISASDAFIGDLTNRRALDYARRPQDLVEMCAAWRAPGNIRSHREQVASDIEIKLKPRTDRLERMPLSPEKAFIGATRLALAALLTRQLTIKHGKDADQAGEAIIALDPAALLPDWNEAEWATLLERGLFGFANYGRVRFHHRSVIEYLAAQRLNCLLAQGHGIKAIKRLLFASTRQGQAVARPSMRPVIAWLALDQPSIFDALCDCGPHILLDHGDPGAMSLSQKKRVLEAFVALHGGTEWNGMQILHLQARRFAEPGLSDLILRLWPTVTNPDVRALLLQLMEASPMPDCLSTARSVALDDKAGHMERLWALEAIGAISRTSLDEITSKMVDDALLWPVEITRQAVVDLYPQNMSTERLLDILRRLPGEKGAVGNLEHRLPHQIRGSSLAIHDLTSLRDGLADFIEHDISYDSKASCFFSSQEHLAPALRAATEATYMVEGLSDGVLRAIMIANPFRDDDHRPARKIALLREAICSATPSSRRRLFWMADDLLCRIYPAASTAKRSFVAGYRGVLRFDEADRAWMKGDLSDKNCDIGKRALMLESLLRLGPPEGTDWKNHALGLTPLVVDQTALVDQLEARIKGADPDPELTRMEAEHQEHERRRKDEEERARTGWLALLKGLRTNPDFHFSPEQLETTVFSLWHAMKSARENDTMGGWNRPFIERHLDRAIADRLRAAMSVFWRNDDPTLPSERPEQERNRYLVRWTMGLAGIAAESEDPHWTENLTDKDARQACRYVSFETSGFPFWLNALTLAHPTAVDDLIGAELKFELEKPAEISEVHTILTHMNGASSSVIELLLPHAKNWLKGHGPALDAFENREWLFERLRKVVELLLRYGSAEDRTELLEMALEYDKHGLEAPFAGIWLRVLFSLSPAAGTLALENAFEPVVPAPESLATDWIARLFGDRLEGFPFSPNRGDFTPALRLRLARLATKHVRFDDDVPFQRRGRVERRDQAERGRSSLFNALIEATGPGAWESKVEAASDPLFVSLRDRIELLAVEGAATEADGEPLTVSEVISLERRNEAPPRTRDEMFDLMVDRLEDIEDLLLTDESPREMWALNNDEKLMRRAIAGALRSMARGSYTVDQEGVTAEEKESDIRLRAISGVEAAIELKLGNMDRSVAQLRTSMREQLVSKYLAPEHRRAGCFLITINKKRTWLNPDNRKRMTFAELIALLNSDANKIMQEFSGAVRIIVKGLDLQPRLPTEAKIR